MALRCLPLSRDTMLQSQLTMVLVHISWIWGLYLLDLGLKLVSKRSKDLCLNLWVLPGHLSVSHLRILSKVVSRDGNTVSRFHPFDGEHPKNGWIRFISWKFSVRTFPEDSPSQLVMIRQMDGIPSLIPSLVVRQRWGASDVPSHPELEAGKGRLVPCFHLIRYRDDCDFGQAGLRKVNKGVWGRRTDADWNLSTDLQLEFPGLQLHVQNVIVRLGVGYRYTRHRKGTISRGFLTSQNWSPMLIISNRYRACSASVRKVLKAKSFLRKKWMRARLMSRMGIEPRGANSNSSMTMDAEALNHYCDMKPL